MRRKENRLRKRRPIEERFWEKVLIDEGCWRWTGARSPSGYGRFIIGVTEGVEWAHRVAFRLGVGPIGPGLHVCHSCDNPGCVRPSHLWLGTAKDNHDDSVSKNRRAHGERIGTARLTEELVRRIRFVKREQPGISNVAIGAMLGVSKESVRSVLLGKSWRHVSEVQ
jgi:hypothetical protein